MEATQETVTKQLNHLNENYAIRGSKLLFKTIYSYGSTGKLNIESWVTKHPSNNDK